MSYSFCMTILESWMLSVSWEKSKIDLELLFGCLYSFICFCFLRKIILIWEAHRFDCFKIGMKHKVFRNWYLFGPKGGLINKYVINIFHMKQDLKRSFYCIKLHSATKCTVTFPNDVLSMILRVRRACDCSFIYWHRVIIPIYLSDMFENVTDTHRIHVSYAVVTWAPSS